MSHDCNAMLGASRFLGDKSRANTMRISLNSDNLQDTKVKTGSTDTSLLNIIMYGTGVAIQIIILIDMLQSQI